MALVAGSAYGVAQSGAWFTDQEQVLGNSIDTGTIDIAVDGNNPWSRSYGYVIEDLKPSQHDYIEFNVQNVGTNPLNLFKTLSNFVGTDDVQSEPECLAEDGDWNGQSCSNQANPDNDLSKVIVYDMRVELYDDPEADPVWWETIYMDEDGATLNNLGRMYLGMIPSGWTMKVIQSYHVDSDTGNQYQGDKLSFDITLDAEQLGKSALVLENKEEVDGDLSHTVLGDAITGSLAYTVRDRAFNYTLSGQAPLGSTKYYLVEYKDPWGTPGTTIAEVNTAADGSFNVSGSVDLNKDLINAKIWLVTDADWNESTNTMSDWNPDDYLFETGLMDYYDADL